MKKGKGNLMTPTQDTYAVRNRRLKNLSIVAAVVVVAILLGQLAGGLLLRAAVL